MTNYRDSRSIDCFPFTSFFRKHFLLLHLHVFSVIKFALFRGSPYPFSFFCCLRRGAFVENVRKCIHRRHRFVVVGIRRWKRPRRRRCSCPCPSHHRRFHRPDPNLTTTPHSTDAPLANASGYAYDWTTAVLSVSKIVIWDDRFAEDNVGSLEDGNASWKLLIYWWWIEDGTASRKNDMDETL